MKTLVAFLMLSAAALGQDDKAPPIGGYTPPIPSPSSPPPALSEERIAVLIDAAVTRAIARQAASAANPLASAQSAPAMATPQAAYAQPAQAFTSYLAAAPAPAQAAQINVLVPPGPMHQAMARFGNHLASKGHPKIRTMTIAPQQSIPTYTLTPAPTVIATAAPTQYTPAVPVAPAQLIQPAPSAPVKASGQR